MTRFSKYLLLSSMLVLASACSVSSDDEDSHDTPDYSIPYLA